jgi:bacterioferritin-associated ferredoxin
MFVCICRAVTLSSLRSVVDQGVRTLDAVEAACGAGGDCGTCRAEILRLLRDVRREPRTDSEAA